jgi:RNA polymerase sigma-70 factor (ECF subfamily)
MPGKQLPGVALVVFAAILFYLSLAWRGRCLCTGRSCLEYRAGVAQLYQRFGPVVYRRCLVLLRDSEAARDATQEIFRKLLHDAEKLAARDTVLPWIYRVATNHCLNERRNKRRRGEEELGLDLPLSEEAPRDLLPERQLAQRVLSRFDAETQAVAVGVLVDGMEHEEVAAALGISRRTVSRKLDRFVENARKYLLRSTG